VSQDPKAAGSEQPSLSFNFDKVIILLFVAFLFSEEARNLLSESGLKWAYLLLLSFGIGYILNPPMRWLAHRLGLVDHPQGRKAHQFPTAFLGGAVVYLAFAITVLWNFSFSTQLKGVALAGTLIFLMGLVDDWRGLAASVKLALQLVAVAILIEYGVVISFFPHGLWGDLGEWLLTAIWVVGITNAVNYLDGMDGLAAGSCAINAFFFSLVALQGHHDFMVYLALPLLGSCLSFLPYNFRFRRPALIFLGDAGSNFLGFMMASLGIMGDWAGDELVKLIVPVLILGVPIFDMSFTSFMRIWHGHVRSVGQWLSYAGRDHIHHRLEALRIGRASAVLVIYAVTTWLGISALVLKNATGLNALLQVAQSVIVFLLLGFFMVFVERQYTAIERQAQDQKDS
jgi:UDP-GlcNAc:undecaprenyl-phosphate GlcNAc-1-phosphate transferase